MGCLERGGGYPVLGDIQGQAEPGSEQPDLVVRCPCSLHRIWTSWPAKVPFNSNNSIIL